MFFDSHAHLTDPDISLKNVVSDICDGQLSKVMTVGYDIKSSLEGVKIADTYDNIYSSVGIHPHSAVDVDDESLRALEKAAKESSNVKAVGEIGLDYYRDLSPREAQRIALIRQIDLAHSLKLPIVLHIRDAYGDMQKILSEHKDKLQQGVLLHCFSGSAEVAKYYTKLGYYISFSGAITFKKANFDDIIKSVPPQLILIETDCPYLSPEPLRGKINRPANVQYVAQKISQVLKLSLEEVANITRNNAIRFFDIK